MLPDFSLLPARKENSWEGSFGIGATALGGWRSCLMEGVEESAASWKAPSLPLSSIQAHLFYHRIS